MVICGTIGPQCPWRNDPHIRARDQDQFRRWTHPRLRSANFWAFPFAASAGGRIGGAAFSKRSPVVGPVQAPPRSAVASGRWGAPVARVMWPTVEGRATPRRRPQSEQVPPWWSPSWMAPIDPFRSRAKKHGAVQQGHRLAGIYGIFRQPAHCALTLAALMIGVQRAISLFTSAASGC
jgi:hypothetical protein